MSDSKIISTKTVYQSKFFKVDQVEIERDGKRFTKDFIERVPVVFILPYTAQNEIYLELQYRDIFQKSLLEIIAGQIDPEEDPLEAAKRELQEETGLQAKNWKKVATWQVGANQKQTIHLFFATDLEEGEQQLDEDEEIETVKLSLDEALQKVENGEISIGSHAATILLFDKLKREGKL